MIIPPEPRVLTAIIVQIFQRPRDIFDLILELNDPKRRRKHSTSNLLSGGTILS
jgi:hypothetical protein